MSNPEKAVPEAFGDVQRLAAINGMIALGRMPSSQDVCWLLQLVGELRKALARYRDATVPEWARVLELKLGSLLLLRTPPGALALEEIRSLSEFLESQLGFAVPIVRLPEGYDLDVLSEPPPGLAMMPASGPIPVKHADQFVRVEGGRQPTLVPDRIKVSKVLEHGTSTRASREDHPQYDARQPVCLSPGEVDALVQSAIVVERMACASEVEMMDTHGMLPSEVRRQAVHRIRSRTGTEGKSMAEESTREQSIRPDLFRLYAEQERSHQQHPEGCSPHDVIQASRRNPIVAAVIGCWRHGELTWEQALCKMVTTLVKQNDRLASVLLINETSFTVTEADPDTPIVSHERSKADG